MKTLYEIAALQINLPFKRINDSKPMVFGPDGYLSHTDETPVRVTRDMVKCGDFQIQCEHPESEWMAFVDRNARLGFSIECKRCSQVVKIKEVVTAPPFIPDEIPKDHRISPVSA